MLSAAKNSTKTPTLYGHYWGEEDLARAGINENKIYNISQQMIYSPLSHTHNNLSSMEAFQFNIFLYAMKKGLESLQNAEFSHRVDKEPKKSMGPVFSFFHEIGSLFPLLPTSNISDIEKNILVLREEIDKMIYFQPFIEKDKIDSEIRREVLYAEINRIASYFNTNKKNSYISKYQEDAEFYQFMINRKLAVSAQERRKTLDNARIGLGFTTTVLATALAVAIITSKNK